jgi:O-antigen/teichoic acid export membrane protein
VSFTHVSHPERISSVFILNWHHNIRRSETLAERLSCPVHYVYVPRQRGAPAWLAAPFRYLLQAIITLRLLQRERPRVVLVLNPPIFAPLLVWAWCAMAHRRFVLDNHSGAFMERRWRWALPLHHWLARRALFSLVISEDDFALARSAGPSVALVRDGIPDFAGKHLTEHTTPFTVVVICAGFDNEPVDDILAAAALCPSIRFRMTGDTATLPARTRAAAPPNMEFTGYLHGAAYVDCLSSSDAALVLSLRNDLSAAAYECLGMGLPMVLAQWPLPQSYFGDAAEYVQIEPRSIADGLRRVEAEYRTRLDRAARMREIRRAEWESAFDPVKRTIGANAEPERDGDGPVDQPEHGDADPAAPRKSHTARLASMIGSVLSGQLVARGLGMVFLIVAARTLSTTRFGLFRYALDAGAMGMVLMQAPVTALARSVAAHRDTGEGRRQLWASVQLIAASAAITAVTIAAVSHWLAVPAIWIIAISIGTGIFETVYALAKAVESSRYLAIAYITMNAGQLVAALTYALIVPVPQIGPFVAMFALSSVAAAAYVLPPLMAKLPKREAAPRTLHSRAESRRNLRELVAFCLPLVAAQLGYMVWAGFDTLFVVHQIGGEVAGRFGVAKTLSAVIILFPAAANAVLLPIASRGSSEEARNALKWMLLGGAAMLVLGVALSVALGPWIVTTLFAHRYAAAAVLLPGLVLGMATFSLYSFLTTYAMGRGRPGIYTWSVAIGVIVEVILAFPMVSHFGALGASYCGFVGGAAALVIATVLLMRPKRIANSGHSPHAPWLQPSNMEQASNAE